MRGVRISYLVDYPECVPQLAPWLFEHWGPILDEQTPDARIEKLEAHMNRDKLPIAWVAHIDGQLVGTAALRVHDLEGREDLTPWLGGVFVASRFVARGSVLHFVRPSRMRLGRAASRHCICSRSTRRPGIRVWAGQWWVRAFGTSAAAT